MESTDWKSKTYTLDWLQTHAQGCTYIHGFVKGALHFLVHVGVIPEGVQWNRKNANPKTSVDPNNIPAVYLAEVALEWDAEGPSTPLQFISALRAEIAGTSENSVVSETLGELGR